MSDTEKGGPEDEYDLEEETELEEGSIMEGGDENELDLEEDYLNRLKTQRKRVPSLLIIIDRRVIQPASQ